MAKVPSGIVKQFAKQRMLVKELYIDGQELVVSNRQNAIRYVDSVNGAAANLGLVPTSACDSITTAIALCTASEGDIIVCLPGHVEAVTASTDIAGGLFLDVAGVTIYFLGEGANRAKITFGTAVGADMNVDAANITLVNPLFVSDLDALTGPIDVNAADFTIIDGEYRDAAAKAATDCIVADANADRMRILGWTYVPSTTGTQKQSNIQVAAADDVIIRGANIVGDFGTGAIENGTAWIRALIEDCVINNLSASPTVGILLQATSTGSMRNVHIRVASGTTYLTANNDMQFFECFGTGTDATAGEKIGTQLAGDIEAKVDVIDAFHDVPTADVTTNAQMRDVVGNKTDAAAAGAVSGTETIVAYAKQVVTQIGVEADTDPVSAVLSGAGGITTWKAAAAPATGVSMSEALRSIYNAVAADSGADSLATQVGIGRVATAVGNVAGSNDDLFTVTGKCMIRLMHGEVTSVIATTTSLALVMSTAAGAIAASTDIVTNVVNTLYLVTGDPDDGLNGDASSGTSQAALARSKTGFHAPFIVNDDHIVQAVNGEGTGLIQWWVHYVPLEASASIAST